MKQLLPALLLAVLGMTTAHTAEAPPTEASLKTMFATMHASTMLDRIWDQMDNMMKTSVQQASGGQPLNDAQQAAAKEMATRIGEIFRETMSWEKLEPIMIRAYQKSVTQSEVDGITKFYASPAGQAMVRKVPLLMQNSMQEMQGMMQEMMPKIEAVARDGQEKIRAAASPDTPKP